MKVRLKDEELKKSDSFREKKGALSFKEGRGFVQRQRYELWWMA